MLCPGLPSATVTYQRVSLSDFLRNILCILYVVSVASPAQKTWGTEQFFFAGKSYNLHTHGTPYILRTVQRICSNLKIGLNISGGPDPPFPFGDATASCSILKDLVGVNLVTP